jgi:protease-4
MNRTSWSLWLALVAFSAAPCVWADEPEPPADDEAVAETVEEEEEPLEAESAGETEEAEPVKMLAELTLDHNVISARMLNIPWTGRTRTFEDVRDTINVWAEQDDIGAVMLDITNFYLPLPEIEELRQGIDRIKKAGKKVYAHLNLCGPEGYLLACAADEICIAPAGVVLLPGIGRAFPFMQGHYQMLGVDYDVITAGRFKYPGFVNQREPNEYFLKEIGAMFDSWFEDYVRMVAEGRGMKPERVREFIDQAAARGANAIYLDLVDQQAFPEEYRDRILRRTGMKLRKAEQIDWSQINSLQDMLNLMSREWDRQKRAHEAIGPKIAVLTARGPFIDVSLGLAFANLAICRDDFIRTLDEIGQDKSIKGLVLRIDSPGGSGYCSSAIYQKLMEINATRPVVVSMGRVAASAGYHIACPARLIFAEPTTITASIGVLGIFPSNWSALNRADYNMYTIERGARSMLLSGYKPLSPEDRAFVQEVIDKSYGDFIDDVARGRGMATEQVRELAGGRVYTGRDAIKLGLVDRLGGIEDAIQAVRRLAGISAGTKVHVVHYPRYASLGEFIADASSVVTLLGLEAQQNTDPLARMLQLAEMPAEPLSAERQLKLLVKGPEPLYWMPLPDLHRMWHPYHESFEGLNPVQEPTPAMIRDVLATP